MKLILLNQKQIDYFRWMDPFLFLNKLTIPEYFAIGACRDEEDKDIPVGLMVCFITDREVVIEWICVDPEYMYRNVGEELLERAFQVTIALGKDRLCALLRQDDQLYAISRLVKSFFEERFFYQVDTFPGEWRFTIEEAAGSRWIEGESDLPRTVALSEVSAKAYTEFINNIPAAGEKYYRLDMSTCERKDFLPDVSRAIIDGGEVCGLLLVRKEGKDFSPVFLYAESEYEKKALVKDAALTLKSSAGEDEQIKVLALSRETVALMRKIMPDRMKPAYMMIASVEDYKQMISEEF